MNIITVFAGRKQNLNILSKYLNKALELNIIQEVHYWNFTRQSDDEIYLKEISNYKRLKIHGNKTIVNIPIIDNSFEFSIETTEQFCIDINRYEGYSIVFGANNTNIFIYNNNNKLIYKFYNKNILNNIKKLIKVSIENNNINIYINKKLLLSYNIKNNIIIKNICFYSNIFRVVNIEYKTVINHNIFLMDTFNHNSWDEYYKHYTNIKYKDDIIIKCDDDIVFIDIYKLPNYINFIKINDYDLVFANIINNGVCAYYQQHKFNLIPKTLMDINYPMDLSIRGLGGILLWGSSKAEALHNYFINNYNTFINKDYNNEFIYIENRFSINFFGYKGKNWHKINGNNVGKNNEETLTLIYQSQRNFKNILYFDFYVSHLSFRDQHILNKFNSDKLLIKYNNLFNTYINKITTKYILYCNISFNYFDNLEGYTLNIIKEFNRINDLLNNKNEISKYNKGIFIFGDYEYYYFMQNNVVNMNKFIDNYVKYIYNIKEIENKYIFNISSPIISDTFFLYNLKKYNIKINKDMLLYKNRYKIYLQFNKILHKKCLKYNLYFCDIEPIFKNGIISDINMLDKFII
jgi:hypothetical protein